MITFKVDEKQFADLARRLDPSKYTKAIDIALFNIGNELKGDAAGGAPYKTGTLSKSIGSPLDKGIWKLNSGKSIQVGTKVEYAAIHEFGGRTGRNRSVVIKERPYMRPAFQKQKQGRALDWITKEISNIINK